MQKLKSLAHFLSQQTTDHHFYLILFSLPEVSLDSRVREGINQSLAEPSNMMYEEAQLQIYTLMHRDSFPRFLNSSVYRDLLASRRRTCLDT